VITHRHGDGRRPGPDPRPGPYRPRGAGTTRAWLQPLHERPWMPEGRADETWSMFLEETRELLDGPFDLLVRLARSRGVQELHVWSRSRLAFHPFDPRSGRRPD